MAWFPLQIFFHEVMPRAFKDSKFSRCSFMTTWFCCCCCCVSPEAWQRWKVFLYTAEETKPDPKEYREYMKCNHPLLRLIYYRKYTRSQNIAHVAVLCLALLYALPHETSLKQQEHGSHHDSEGQVDVHCGTLNEATVIFLGAVTFNLAENIYEGCLGLITHGTNAGKIIGGLISSLLILYGFLMNSLHGFWPPIDLMVEVLLVSLFVGDTLLTSGVYLTLRCLRLVGFAAEAEGYEHVVLEPMPDITASSSDGLHAELGNAIPETRVEAMQLGELQTPETTQLGELQTPEATRTTSSQGETV